MPSSWCAWSLRSHCWSACPPNSRVLDPSLRPELFLLQPFAEIAWFVLELLPPRILFGFTISSLYCPVSVVLFRKVKLQEPNEVNQGIAPGDPIGIVGASAAGLFTALLFARVGCGMKSTAYERAFCSAVVGADGAQSGVARAAGWPMLTTVPLVQALVRLPSGMPSDTVRVWFVPDDTPYFYWLIPESRERGALGLIGTNGQQTRRCLERFLEKRRFKPLAFKGPRLPLSQL